MSTTLPDGHVVHALLAAAVEYFPAVQSAQDSLPLVPVAYLPATQALLTVALQLCPLAHGLQLLAPLAPAYLLVGQAVQLGPTEPVVLIYVPATQEIHVV